MNILIVDDNETNLYLLRTLLSANTYNVLEASNGVEALDVLNKQQIDMIISDILMPVMDGFSLCIEVKKNIKFHSIPFIIYTATYTGIKDEEFAHEIGADKFIIKPCEPDIFIQNVNEVFGKNTNKNENEFPLINDDDNVLKLYNARLVRKLEQKMLEAENEIKARINAENALNRSTSLLNATQNISKTAGWEWDILNQEMFWTDQVYTLHELDPNELKTNDINLLNLSFNCFDLEDRDKVLKAFTLCEKEGKSYELEAQFITLKGNKLFVKTAAHAIFDNNIIIKVLGYFQDCTERILAQKEQDKLKDDLIQSQKLESLGQLAGGIAHDFNNILTVILGYSDILLQNLNISAETCKEITEIDKAGKRALELTKQLLIFSRKHIFQPKIINVNCVIKELQNMLNRLIGEHIVIKTYLEENIGLIKADKSQIQQVIMNLVINARDAMPKGGEIIIETLSADIQNEPSINLKKGKYVIIKVKDNGFGMNKDTLSKIFEPFFTTKEIGKGTGLGLSTVYGIIQQSYGYINVISEVDNGSEFIIYLPITDEKIIYNKVLFEEKDILGNQELIVVAEDEQALRLLIEKMLKKLNYRVICYDNGESAYENIVKNHLIPDLLLTDIVMPIMNGKDLTLKLKKILPDLKVLYMTGYSDNTIIDNDALFPNNPFLLKPFTINAIAQQIKTQLYNM